MRHIHVHLLDICVDTCRFELELLTNFSNLHYTILYILNIVTKQSGYL